MTIELKNPEAPATSKQLWLLHVLTKTDTRNLNITMAEACKRIEVLKSGNPTDSKPNKTTTLDKPEVIQGKKPLYTMHYCLMFCVPGSTHKMSTHKEVWRACNTSQDLKAITKLYNERLIHLVTDNKWSKTTAYVLVECRKAVYAKIMLESGKSIYIGTSTKNELARILKDSCIK